VLLSNALINQGKIETPCIMGWSDGEMFLLPVGSQAHNLAIEFTHRQRQKLSAKDLVPGGIYARKLDGSCATYLGYLDFHTINWVGENACNKEYGRRHVFLRNQNWTIMGADGFYAKIGEISKEELCKKLSRYKEYQTNSKLGDLILVDPDFSGIESKKEKQTFYLSADFNGLRTVLSKMEINFIHEKPYIFFWDREGHIEQEKFITKEVHVPELLKMLFNALKLQFEGKSQHRDWESTFTRDVILNGNVIEDLERNLKTLNIKVLHRETGCGPILMSRVRKNELPGQFVAIDNDVNAWAQ
jgi:hypothetical protein